ncbi:DUF1648 domain-containing protein [Streptomyces sp. NPDC058221]|uniref:DUF1648 domain-containing protein n=1 Tax=Streptomyces sp. NPDC058221 TaxID=3346388 RepID=UPI0036EAC2B9
MNRKNLGRAVLAALPFLIAAAVDLILFADRRDRLPAQLASHFVGNGRVDDHAGQGSYIALVTIVLLGTGVLWALMAAAGKYSGGGYRKLVASGYAIAGPLGYLLAVVMLINVDAAEDAQGRVQDVSFPMWHMAVAAGVAVLAFGLGLLIARASPVPEESVAGPAVGAERIALAKGEIAGWARGAGSWWLPLAPLVALGGGVYLLLTSGSGGAVPTLVIGVVLANFARPYVTADRRGLRVSGLLPWPRIGVPLDRIETASSSDINVLTEYGGWGYRFRPGRSGVMIRSGEAIVVRLSNGRDFAVTVDDAATAAGLLNTLIDQRRTDH